MEFKRKDKIQVMVGILILVCGLGSLSMYLFEIANIEGQWAFNWFFLNLFGGITGLATLFLFIGGIVGFNEHR